MLVEWSYQIEQAKDIKLILPVFLVSERSAKGWPLAFRDVYSPSVLDSVHGNFVACHLDTEPDNDPLDGFGNGFPLRHGGGES